MNRLKEKAIHKIEDWKNHSKVASKRYGVALCGILISLSLREMQQQQRESQIGIKMAIECDLFGIYD